MSSRAQQARRLDDVFRALSDASRRRMIDQLSVGPASVSELAAPLDMALPSVLKHLSVLESGGLVTSQKAGRVRTYRIAPDAISAVDAWVSARKARWNAQFDHLEALLAETTATATARGRRR